ncbi:hypothetical protein C2R22_14590 [Salinigranum rubrum]|uniref:Diguanylate cyclase n=1 Tax=Salinigranum rubrum TaxID=755307 RepID=A0A2I8VLB1_9EURY|nr:PAS domain S-box protein [Salinigranum rubrum]AUV82720.1 hypothetical protein C2R22_14590 [Salinigranum rubrum]
MSEQRATASNDRSSRQAVYEAFADRSRSVEEAVERALTVGTDRLGVGLGFLTEITEERQVIRTVQASGTDGTIEAGDSCPLDRAYCRRTIQQDGALCVQDATSSTAVSPAAYDAFGLDTYVGVKVTVNEEVYGTVCFADTEPRAEPFPESDQLFVEVLAQLIGQALERRRHEQSLREQNERLRAEKRRIQRIADTTYDLLFEIDPDTRLTYVSTAVGTVLGYTPEEAMGNSFAEYIAPSSLPAATAAFERVFDGEPVRDLELTAVTADGDEAVIEINGKPIVEDEDVAAVQGVARDITARREREAELRLKTRAVDDATVGVTIADATRPNNPLVYVNEAFEELTGYSTDEMLGRNCRLLQGPATDEATVATLREAIDAGDSVSVDLVNYRKGGAPFWNNVRVVPVEDSAGDASHFVGFQEDATDRVRTNSLIELLNRVLRHNLRNELNVLQGYGQLLSDPAQLDGADVDAGRIIHETVEDLMSLSDQVRELEHIARQDRDPTHVDVSQLLADVTAHAHELSPDATVESRVDLPDGRGICAGAELTRAFEELVENAIRHADDPPTTVTVTAREAGDDVKLVVADDGPGIPPVEASVIEAGRETAVEHGTGLGLWLVNWIVTRYGGSFQIRPAGSDGASGTVAVVSLPGLNPDDDPDDVVRPHTTLFQ